MAAALAAALAAELMVAVAKAAIARLAVRSGGRLCVVVVVVVEKCWGAPMLCGAVCCVLCV